MTLFNTFQFPEGNEKKLDKVLEQFERYCNPRKNVVFERNQFCQTTQEGSETVDQFVTRLKNNVKSCEYESVDDMVRDKFVFSIRDLAVKERLLRDKKLTLKKAICTARASEASKKQIKAMASKEQRNENPSLNEIRYGGKQKKNSTLRPGSGPSSQQGNCKFCGSSHSCEKNHKTTLVLLLVKRVVIFREKTILLACAERNCKIFAGKQCMPWLKRQMTPTPELIC